MSTWQRSAQRRNRLRGFAGLVTAGALLVAGVLASTTVSASASTTRTVKDLWSVSFSEDDCSGKTVVTLVNNTDDLPGPGIGLVFNVDGASTAVDAGTTKTVDIVWPQSEDVDVNLTGVFETPEVDTAVKSKSFQKPQTEWHHNWERPVGCWEVVVTHNCNATFTVKVKNTGPDQEKFKYQKSGSAAVTQQVAAGATVTLPLFKDDQLTLTLDGKAREPIAWVQPVCATPTTAAPTTAPPTTTQQPPAAAPQGGLPVTGSSLTGGIVAGSALGVAGLALLFWVLAHRRRENEAETAQLDD